MNSKEAFDMYAQPKKSKAGEPLRQSKKRLPQQQQMSRGPQLITGTDKISKPVMEHTLKPMPKIPDLNIDQSYMSKSKQVEFLLKRKQIKQNQQMEVMLYLHDNDKQRGIDQQDAKQKKNKSTQNLLTSNSFNVTQIGAGLTPF